MITTLFLLILISFEVWYITSNQFKDASVPAYVGQIVRKGTMFRAAAGLLFLVCTAMFVVKLGWGSGISSAIVSLMATASLIVAIQPFRLVRISILAALYLSFLLFEIFIY